MSADVTEPYSVLFSPTRRRDLDLGCAEPLAERLGLALLFGVARFGALLLALDLPLVGLGHRQRELARQQVIARVAGAPP